MPKEDLIEMKAVVTEAMPNGYFRVKLDTNGKIALCHVCGKIRKFSIKIIPGDEVIVGLSPYDLTKGRIERRISKKRFEEEYEEE